jgi:PAS domain S-box-containing protein
MYVTAGFLMSVRQFLTAALIATGILPILIFVLAFRPILTKHIDDDIRLRSDVMLRVLSAQAGSSLLDGTRKDLPTLLILAESLSSGFRQADRESELLGAFRLSACEYSLLVVLNASGRIEASTSSRGTVGSYYALHAPLDPGSVSFSNPFLSELSGAVVVEAAYSNGHKTVVALLDLGEISSKLVLIAQSPWDRLGVVDGVGRYLACSDPSRAQRLEEVSPTFLVPGPVLIESEGRLYYAGSRPVAGTDWRLLYLLDAGTADAPMTAFMHSIVILVIAAIGGILALSLFARRNISAPLSALVSRIGLIADGSYSDRIGGQFFSEFSEIGRAFNEMADSIELRDRELQRSEERYRLLFYRNRVPALLLAPGSGRISNANDAAIAYYCYSKAALLELSLKELDESRPEFLDAELLSASQGQEGRFLSRHRLSSGEIRDVELYVSPIEFEGESELYCIVFDVTQRRMAEERMAKALAERTLLLREVYHRVKNNLQIIASLLNLQANGTADSIALYSLRVAQDRVYAMSVAHELVYQVEDLSSLGIDEYAERIVSNLQIAYGAPEGSIHMNFLPMKLELEKAIPFGLALNELVSNAFKYASPTAASPVRISLELGSDERGTEGALFVIEDSGPGMAAEVLSAGDKLGSLGLSLIRALAEQLGGQARWSIGDSGSGTRVELRFPVKCEASLAEESP